MLREARDPDNAKLYPNDPDMQEFCNEVITCFKVPGTDLIVEDGGVDDTIVVRANKWGRVYQPLTDWLAAQGIGWDEF